MSSYDPKELEDIKPGPISFMAAHPVAANLLMLILLLGGFLLMTRSTQEIFPEFDLDMVTTTMIYPGASPEEVEQSIVLPIENALRDVNGIGKMTSIASEGYGHVTVEIDDVDNMLRIAQDIKTAVDQITTFPVDAEELKVTVNAPKRQTLELALYGDASEAALRKEAEHLEELLEASPDIDIVELGGVRDYEIHIEVPEENLRRYNLKMSDIATIISRTAIDIGGGSLSTSTGEVLVRMNERRNMADDFLNIPIITNTNASIVTLGDIAQIKDTFEDTEEYATFNGKPAVLINIFRVGKQTPIGVSEATMKIVNELNQTLPSGLKIAVVEDSSIVFGQRAELLIKNGITGLILVIIFLALFLDIRLALWVSLGIPISYMGAFLLFPYTDFSINMVSMFAFIIALGIVVDDAIVVGENIYHKREQGMPPLKASVEGAREIAIPVFVSVLTNIVAFVPMLFIPGFMGKIFSIIPVVVIATFFISLIESLFILPAHLKYKQAKTMKKGIFLSIINAQKKFNRGFERFVHDFYKPAIIKALYYRYISLCVFFSVLIVTGAYVAGGHLGLQMFPRVESDFSYAQATLKVGAPKAEVKNVENALVNAAQKVIDAHGGDALSVGIFSQVEENVITVRTFLTDPDVRPITTTQFTDFWREGMPQLAGVKSMIFSSNHGGPGAGAALTIELSHRDKDILDEAAVYLADALRDYPQAQDINDGSAQGKRQFDFTMTDLGYAAGLTPADVGRQVRAAFYGAEAFKQQRGRNEVRVLVILPEEQRNSGYYLQNMMIKTPSDDDILLGDVVKMEEGRAFTTINRRDGRRVLAVESDVNPPSQSNMIINALLADTLPQMEKLFPGLTYSFEGQQAEQLESLESLKIGMILVLFVIYAILALLFSSYFQPLMVMIAIPFSIVGAIAGHFIMGIEMSIVSMFGIIALSGVVVNDSLILIDLANRKRKEGLDAFNAAITAATLRFRAIILTSLTTFVGIAPMMFETSMQAKFLVPMAVSLGFGILFSTFLTLVLIPALYMVLDDFKHIFQRFLAAIKG